MQNFGICTPLRIIQLLLNGPPITNINEHFAKITLKLDENNFYAPI